MNKLKLIYFTTSIFVTLITSYPVQAQCINRCGPYLDIEPFVVKANDSLLSNSIYAVKLPDNDILGDFKEEYHLDLKEAWGGRIAAGWNFPICTNCFGVSLEYTFFNHENSASVQNDTRNSDGLPVLAPAEFIDIVEEDSAKFSFAKSKFSQHYETVDLLAARNLFMCHGSDIKIFAGIRYFHLNEELHNNYEFNGNIEDVQVRSHYNVNFSNRSDNIGPHLGAHVFYPLFRGFGLTGQLTGSLLYGESKSEFHNFFDLSPGGTPLMGPTRLSSSNHHDDTAHVIPAISGKVGIAYQVNYCNCSSLVLEAGYRGDKYFNAADDVAYQQLLAGDDINSKCNYQDFSISGAYFCLTLHS